jgi:hypothetical protein
MRKRYGYPELTPEIKRKILGLNSAKLYGIKLASNLAAQFKPVPKDYSSRMTPEFRRLMEVDKPVAAAFGAGDQLDLIRERYAAAGGAPDHLRYGWIRSG